MPSTRIVHYLEPGTDRAQRLKSSAQFRAGARCGWGGTPQNYPEQFSQSEQWVNCPACRKYQGWD